MFEIIIKNGILIDGSGNPWFKADVGIKDEKITSIGDLSGFSVETIIDASNKIVSPGWIDFHAHSDTLLLADPYVRNKLYQGITTDVSGHCGFSAAPLGKKFLYTWWTDVPPNEKYKVVYWELGRELLERFGINADWHSYGEYFDRLEKRGLSINHCAFVGHNNLRAAVGADYKDGAERVDEKELEEMKELLAQSMMEGALGFSTEHGSHVNLPYDEGEIIELCKVAHKYGGLFSNDIRSYGQTFIEAVKEAILTTHAVGIPTTIAHIGARGKENWGKARHAIKLIEEARSAGLPIVFDQIPMPLRKASQKLVNLLPNWLLDTSEDKLSEKLSDPNIRAKLKVDMKVGINNERFSQKNFPLKGYLWMDITHIITAENAEEFVGRSIADISYEMGVDPWDAIINIIKETGGNGSYYVEPQSHEDVCMFLKHPSCIGFGTDCTCADAISRAHRKAEGMLRIRSKYAVFPHMIENYVKKYGVIPLEEAIRKLTSAPAQFLGLKDRGLLREGMYADIVIFDYGNLADKTSPLGIPLQPTEGIEYVLVNGTVVMDHYVHNKELPGMILRRNPKISGE